MESIRRVVAARTPERPARVLLDAGATKAALLAQARDARILHLATHYVPDAAVHGRLSRLALTAPESPTQDDDGFLRLTDLLEGGAGRLPRCDLVVLSACETQAGYAQGGELVYSLPLAFLACGAASVIASLWPVEDDSTADLMAALYATLLKDGADAGGDLHVLQALTSARRALRKAHPEPYYWAPFVVIGEPRVRPR